MDATPGCSILKSSQDRKTPKKPIKVVPFDQSDTEIDINTSNNNNKELSDVTTDRGLSPIAIDKNSAKKDKENSNRRPKIKRQDAVTSEPTSFMTRSQRRMSLKTPQTADKCPRRTGGFGRGREQC